MVGREEEDEVEWLELVELARVPEIAVHPAMRSSEVVLPPIVGGVGREVREHQVVGSSSRRSSASGCRTSDRPRARARLRIAPVDTSSSASGTERQVGHVTVGGRLSLVGDRARVLRVLRLVIEAIEVSEIGSYTCEPEAIGLRSRAAGGADRASAQAYRHCPGHGARTTSS